MYIWIEEPNKSFSITLHCPDLTTKKMLVKFVKTSTLYWHGTSLDKRRENYDEKDENTASTTYCIERLLA